MGGLFPCAILLVLFAIVSSPVLAGIHELWWNITYVEKANPDGLFERRVIGVNGTWPPPPISVSTSDLLVVHATNSIPKPVTLHHHGMFFNSTTWMDGVMGVTQCGIPPGQTFDYVVPINSSGQWGTYWVHDHSTGLYTDGLRAPLLLHPPTEAYSYDEEFTVVLGDWYHEQQSVLLQQYINVDDPDGEEPVPNSSLIYFAQNASYLPPKPGTNPSPVTAAVGFNENATLPFVPGKTYRLRIINTSSFATFVFWIDGHAMRIIEADGTDVQQSPIDTISLGVAQRYSILVTALNDTTANWAIHANMDPSMFDYLPITLQLNLTSSVTYNSSAPLKDFGHVEEYLDVNDTALVPLEVIPQFPPATKTIDLTDLFDLMTDGTNRAVVNNITYNSPLVPTVFSALSLGSNATVPSAYVPLSFVVDHLEVYDILLKNADDGAHPFHLHGHTFQIVNRAQNFSSSDPALNPPLVEGQANPMRRDTVYIDGGASVTLRVVADNPGAWFFHCHIEWHLQAGLAVQIIEAPLIAQQRNNVPAFMYDHCQALKLPFSGNAAGHPSTTDLSGLTLGPYPTTVSGDGDGDS